ncbi:signal peptidase I [Curtobacterium sp. ISL-83]|uniref:signal peptidase I n=1 Tax=Curtobacterium sp. ISL-83 TaxID=2819145 RepID=UPI001BE55193|nr:signal peptidase I [Curtobacterium sp. ISL-83]MBT2504266.1 signal peptidase I [Curtobacterium sp. ISL-83]
MITTTGSHHTPTQTHQKAFGEGWAGLIVVTAGKTYLTLLAALAGIAVLPALLGGTASVVQSGSMEPNISPGDVVITTPLPSDDALPVGRVITFHVDDMLVVHRLIAVRHGDALVTKGDANPQADTWTATRADITGRARLLVPYVGLPSFWLGHGNVRAFGSWAALTMLAIVLVALSVRRRTLPDDASGDETTHGDGIEADPAACAIDPDPAAQVEAAGRAPARRSARTAVIVGAALLAVVPVACAAPAAQAAGVFTGQTRTSLAWTAKSYAPISAGSMAGYGLIAATSVNDTSTFFNNSTTSGSIATTPGTTVSGFSRGDVGGTTELNTSAAKAAMASAVTARAALAQRPVTQTLAPSLSGTLPGGVYTTTTGAFTVPGTLTLDAKGDSTARFIFTTTSTLTMPRGSRILLANGAKAANVWWIVGTTATIGSSGSTTTAAGNYIVNGAAALSQATVTGRIVSATGAISLSATTVNPVN